MLVHLSDRTLIRLSGADSYSFLQGMITNDMRLLEQQPALFTALLSPQGKLLFDFFIVKDGDGLLLDADSGAAEELLKLLKRYRLRADVTFTPLPEHFIYLTTEAQNGTACFRDPRSADLGYRLITAAPLGDALPLIHYHQQRLRLGIPEAAYDKTERSFPMDLGYDAFRAIQFNKGCYVGQEVTARMHYKQIFRKCPFIIEGDHPLPIFGTPITASEKELGELHSTSGTIGLAILKVPDTLECLNSGMAFQAGGESISVRLPDYLQAKADSLLQSNPTGIND